ncbi:MAG: hypothetical protein KY476_03110 [Planctomycetes bacterium]|nr:hypothetical protein [Planctomycetota bacterium]
MPAAWRDDAHLYDVEFVGARAGWAVGDRGTILRTVDGGGTWEVVETPVSCPLCSVCFLSDQVGWVAGGGTTPWTRLDGGVLLATSDGGQTWRELAAEALPPLHHLQFFDLETGVVVGAATPRGPSGIWVTEDGGQTWTPLPGPGGDGWRAAAFLPGSPLSDVGRGQIPLRTSDYDNRGADAPQRGLTPLGILPLTGVVAGTRGRTAVVGAGQVVPPRIEQLGLRGIADMALSDAQHGWAVGDGGLVLSTTNGGIVWQEASQGTRDKGQGPESRGSRVEGREPEMGSKDTRPRSLNARPSNPRLADFADWKAVAVRGPKVWIAGSPGSAVWHSSDGGRRWIRQPTAVTQPIHSLTFTSETTGWAVGALGLILRTEDGGQSWQPQRGVGRRLAVLAVAARSEHVPLHLLASQCGEDGYRGGVLLAARRDTGPDGNQNARADLRLQEAIAACGGSAAIAEWRFPVELPGLERDRERLIEDWQHRTEGRLGEALIGRLVAQLRVWRPSVLTLEEPGPDDALGRVLNEAILKAVEDAADATRFLAQRELAGLEPWRVEKVYLRLPPGSTGHAHVDPFEYQPRLGRTLSDQTAPARGLLGLSPSSTAGREAWRALADRSATLLPPLLRGGQGGSIAGGDFFAGLWIEPGSDARRPLEPLPETNSERLRQLAARRRNTHAYAERYLDDPKRAAGLVAMLRPLTDDLPDDAAALELARLADQYRRRSQWDMVEAASVELVGRYPDQPIAHDAMRWLFQLWTGGEPSWQRARQIQVQKGQLAQNLQSVGETIDHALRLAGEDPWQRDESVLQTGADAIALRELEGQLVDTGRNDWTSGTLTIWQRQAVGLAALMRRRAPALYASPDIQLPLAALFRKRAALRSAGHVLRPYAESTAESAWGAIAAGELWLLNPTPEGPRPIAVAKRTPERPHLDGRLSDACWREAEALPLLPHEQSLSSPTLATTGQADVTSASGGHFAFVLFSYDAEYLYLAASVPRDADAPADKPQLAGRRHDADLSPFDRIAFDFDIDRDYATWYRFEVDQRGWTAERCWDDATWNPIWHVAAEADESHWRIEAAIPLAELLPEPPIRGSVWSLGVVRTIPAVRLESWTAPPSSQPRPESFGLLRFQ